MVVHSHSYRGCVKLLQGTGVLLGRYSWGSIELRGGACKATGVRPGRATVKQAEHQNTAAADEHQDDVIRDSRLRKE